ncbi:hypothetical protein AB0W38_00495 [Aliarcobacter butzleri]|uniref:hypothetical protein n=1 Tax=Aliarcobacter butzleri TaxID=28197 RepID=UPI00344DD58B
MNFTNTFKKFISYSLIFVFAFSNTAQAASQIEASDRTTEVISDMRSSSVPSDLPVAGVSDFFDKENIHLIKNFDLSAYADKKVFVGYGVYDHSEDNCKFVEQPGVTKAQIDSTFSFKHKFNQNTYAVSMDRMTYSECKALGDQFGGYPVVVDSAAEAMFVASNFSGAQISSSDIEKVWLGAERGDCSETYYTNEFGDKQFYENWQSDLDKISCDSTKLNLKIDQYGKFLKTNQYVPAYCVLEFEGEDIYKPLKICASWWKVQREYPNEAPGLYDTQMLKRINQADIPVQMAVCTQYESDTAAAQEEQGTRIAHCTEYYSATVSPECVRDMHQPICKVNECGGYINNACRLVNEATVGKGYVKGEVMKNGVMTETKVKDNIVTKEYECPPSPPSNDKCVEQSAVIIYPKECPNSQCDALKECILAAASDKTAIDTCYTNYQCIKIYGGRDIPPAIDPVTGDVTHLYGKCPDSPVSDGSILEFPVNIQEKINRTCAEYEVIETRENVTQNCVLERPYEDHEVNMSITEIDEYEDNPSCIRTDTVDESLTMQDITMTLNSKGWFKHKMTRVNLDDTVDTVLVGGDDLYTLGSAMPEQFPENNGQVQTQEITQNVTAEVDFNVDCSEFDPTAGGASWFNKNIAVFQNLDGAGDPTISDPAFDTESLTGAKGTVMIPDSFINTEEECANYASNNGFDSYLSSYTYSKNIVTGVDSCTLNLNKVGADFQLDSIFRISEDSLKYDFSGTMSGLDCMKKAYCLDGYYNEGSFGSNEAIGDCQVTTGEGSPTSYQDTLIAIAMNAAGITIPPPATGATKEECTPVESYENASSRIDGVQNIFVFEDYLRGGWGYYSNFNSWDAQTNRVYVSTAEFTDKVVPMQPMSVITDYMQYHSILKHESHKAKEPDVATSFIGGAAAGLAAWIMGLSATGIGIVVVVVIIILLFLLTKSKDMDRQHTEYHIYKDIPVDLYHEGPYESRFRHAAAAVPGEQSSHYDPANFVRMTYQHVKTDTGRYEPGEFMEKLKQLYTHKESTLVCQGFEQSEVSRLTHPDELSINYGYPSCKWYQPWCTKMDTNLNEIVTNNNLFAENVTSPQVPVLYPGIAISKSKMQKQVGTVYLGAVNTMVILVPYIGDYKIEAYNKYDTLLSTRTIHENSFAGVTDPMGLKFAQVNFGLNMNIAPGLIPGGNIDACIKDRAVEWGGGVSGVFHESQRTDLSNYCQKSNDLYVKDQAMTKLFVQPLNMDRGFTYELTAPMPFPNRVWIATLDNREVRNYRCFGEFDECSDTDFQEVQ